MTAPSDLDVTAVTLRIKAMDFLSRREYSCQELAARLVTKYALTADQLLLLDATLDALVNDGLLSDQRFAESLVQVRIRRGQGPQRIRQELRERGIGNELATAALQNAEADWPQLARDVAKKKFGNEAATDVRQQVRRRRFLQYRGFDAEQINFALDP